MNYTSKRGGVFFDSGARKSYLLASDINQLASVCDITRYTIVKPDKTLQPTKLFKHRGFPGVLLSHIAQMSEIDRFDHLCYVSNDGDVLLASREEFKDQPEPLRFRKCKISFPEISYLDANWGPIWSDLADIDAYNGSGPYPAINPLKDKVFKKPLLLATHSMNADGSATAQMLDSAPEYLEGKQYTFFEVAKAKMEPTSDPEQTFAIPYSYLFGVCTDVQPGEMFGYWAPSYLKHYQPVMTVGNAIVSTTSPTYKLFPFFAAKPFFITRKLLKFSPESIDKVGSPLNVIMNSAKLGLPADKKVVGTTISPRSYFERQFRASLTAGKVDQMPCTHYVLFGAVDGVGCFEPEFTPGRYVVPPERRTQKRTITGTTIFRQSSQGVIDIYLDQAFLFGIPKWMLRRWSLTKYPSGQITNYESNLESDKAFGRIAVNSMQQQNDVTQEVFSSEVYAMGVEISPSRYWYEQQDWAQNHLRWQSHSQYITSWPTVANAISNAPPPSSMNASSLFPSFIEPASFQIYDGLVNDSLSVDAFLPQPLTLTGGARIGIRREQGKSDKLTDYLMFASWLPGLSSILETEPAVIGASESKLFSMTQLVGFGSATVKPDTLSNYSDDISAKVQAGIIQPDAATAMYLNDPGLTMVPLSRDQLDRVLPTVEAPFRLQTMRMPSLWEMNVELLLDLAYEEARAKSKEVGDEIINSL